MGKFLLALLVLSVLLQLPMLWHTSIKESLKDARSEPPILLPLPLPSPTVATNAMNPSKSHVPSIPADIESNVKKTNKFTKVYTTPPLRFLSVDLAVDAPHKALKEVCDKEAKMNQFSKGASSVLPRIGSQVHSYNAGTGSSTPAADSPLPLP